MPAKAASKNSWSIKVNNEYKAKLLKKGTQWYLEDSNVSMKEKSASERVAYLTVPPKSGLVSGYYYFRQDGQLDKRRTFHTLNTRIGSVRFKGSYYFGETDDCQHDAAIVYGKKTDYVIVALISKNI